MKASATGLRRGDKLRQEEEDILKHKPPCSEARL